MWCIGTREADIHTTMSGWLRSCFVSREARYRDQVLAWRSNYISAEILQRIDGSLTSTLPIWDPADRPQLQPVGEVTLETYKGPVGFYAAVWTGVIITCKADTSTSGGMLPEAVMRRVMIERMNRETRYFEPPLTSAEVDVLCASGRLTRGRHLPLGYLHNILALSMLVLLGWSLWVQARELPGRLRLWLFIERWRYDPDRCPRCGYSLLGFVRGKCPECGEKFPPLPSVHSHPDDSGLTQSRSS